jgi:hypothetical protein
MVFERIEADILLHLSPEGRGRASEASEGEGVRKAQYFLNLPNPLTPTLSPPGRGSAPCQRGYINV